MSTIPTTQRGLILAGVVAILKVMNASVFANLFRAIEAKAWTPGDPNRPTIVVNDDGATKSGDKNQSETSKVILLKFQVILNLADNFGSEDAVVSWTDVVETIRLGLQNYNPKCGVKRLDVGDDTPIKAEFGGVSEHIWVIECEAEYFVEVQGFA